MKREITFDEETKNRLRFCGRVVRTFQKGELAMCCDNCGVRFYIERADCRASFFPSLDDLERFCENLLKGRPKSNPKTAHRQSYRYKSLVASYQ